VYGKFAGTTPTCAAFWGASSAACSAAANACLFCTLCCTTKSNAKRPAPRKTHGATCVKIFPVIYGLDYQLTKILKKAGHVVLFHYFRSLNCFNAKKKTK
jgi:hypothetical protein